MLQAYDIGEPSSIPNDKRLKFVGPRRQWIVWCPQLGNTGFVGHSQGSVYLRAILWAGERKDKGEIVRVGLE